MRHSAGCAPGSPPRPWAQLAAAAAHGSAAAADSGSAAISASCAASFAAASGDSMPARYVLNCVRPCDRRFAACNGAAAAAGDLAAWCAACSAGLLAPNVDRSISRHIERLHVGEAEARFLRGPPHTWPHARRLVEGRRNVFRRWRHRPPQRVQVVRHLHAAHTLQPVHAHLCICTIRTPDGIAHWIRMLRRRT